MTKKRLLTMAGGSLGVLPFNIYFIYIAINHNVPELLVFWSVWLGMSLTFSFALFFKAFKVK